MEIKTVARNGSNVVATLRKVTVGHAVRILFTEVMQSGGYSTEACFIDKGPKYFFFEVDTTRYSFKCTKLERERFMLVWEYCRRPRTEGWYCEECREIGTPRFNARSMMFYMTWLLNDREYDQLRMVRKRVYDFTSLTEIANEIDKIIDRASLPSVVIAA